MANSNSNAQTLAGLRLEQTAFRRALLADTTLTGYAADWSVFERWCGLYQLAALPATPETVGLFLTDQLREHKVTTARRRKFAIAFRHRAEGLASPVTPEVADLLVGAQRLRAEKPRQMRPITVRELRRMSIALARSGTAVDMRNRALLVVGWASSLRRSTLGALRLADVEFVPQGIVLSVSREKNDQEGVGRLVPIPRGKHPHTDPVRVLKGWLRVRGPSPGPLFSRLDPMHEGEALSGEGVCRIVKRAVMGIGIDPAQHGAHSLRSGMISAAAEANISALRISNFTNQSTEMVTLYFRRSELWRNNVCGKLGL